MNGKLFTNDEVMLARFVFAKWLLAAKKKEDPQAFLVEELKRQGIGEMVPEGIAHGVASYSISGSIVYALNDAYLVVWSRSIEILADAALAKAWQLDFLEKPHGI